MPVKVHPLDLYPPTIVTLAAFVSTTTMESSFQMLLLLYGLKHANEAGTFSVMDAAERIAHFFRLRVEAGLSPEKQARTKAENFTAAKLRHTLVDQPYPIFLRYFLLSYDKPNECLSFPGALWEYLRTHPTEMTQVRALALGRLAEHYSSRSRPDAQARLDVEAWVKIALERDGESDHVND